MATKKTGNKKGSLEKKSLWVIYTISFFLFMSILTPLGDFVKEQSIALWERFFSSPHLVVIFQETTNREFGEYNTERGKSSISLYKEANDTSAAIIEKYYIDPDIIELFVATGVAHSIVGVIPPKGVKGIDVTIANVNRKVAENIEITLRGRNIGQIGLLTNREEINIKDLIDVVCDSTGCSISIQRLAGRSAVYLSFGNTNPESDLTVSCVGETLCQIDLIKRHAATIPLGSYVDINYTNPDYIVRTPFWNANDAFCYILDAQSRQWISPSGCTPQKGSNIVP